VIHSTTHQSEKLPVFFSFFFSGLKSQVSTTNYLL
jgi:hypothetical protein